MNFLVATFYAAVITLVGFSAQARIERVLPKDKSVPVRQVNIYFDGMISQEKVSDLTLSIATANINYPELEKINLLINSGGGDMDWGQSAFWAVKSSKIPVRTINMSFIASAATLMYCASQERATMEGSSFLLHPAAFYFDSKARLKPDELAQTQAILKRSNALFAQAYERCTNFDSSEISNILKSEYNSRFISDEGALKAGLSSEVLTALPPADAFVYILDK